MSRCTIVAVCLLLAACGAPQEQEEQSDLPGRMLSDPAPNEDGVLRVLVYHDMEGLSGQDDPRTFSFRETEYYPRGRELLTGDVNAVVDGLFAGGADEVHVVDAHGSGNPEPDLLLDRLDPRVELIYRDTAFGPYVDLVEPGVYDAVAVVGMHAKTGSHGFANHTYTLGMDVLMNDMSITETEIIGYSWGRVGVPVILASGDDRLQENLGTMPWIQYVTVKRATSASTAEPRPLEDARADLRESAMRAVEGLADARVMTLTTPISAALHVVPPATLAMLEGVPGIEYEDNVVTFEAPDYRAAYDGVIALMGVARAGYTDVLFERLRQRPDFQETYSDFVAALFARWLDYESDRWSPPTQPEPRPGRRYHGAN
jgi:D-amino peptidase